MINQEYLDLLKKEGLAKTPSQRARGLFFGFLITFKDDFPELKDYLLDEEEHRAIFPYDDFQLYQIKLCKTNADTLKMELKVPLLGNVVEGEYETFLNLLGTYHVTNLGHLNNTTGFSILSKGSEDKIAFEKTKQELKESFNLEKLAIVVSNYYETTQYPTKLCNFLGTNNVILAYKNFIK